MSDFADEHGHPRHEYIALLISKLTCCAASENFHHDSVRRACAPLLPRVRRRTIHKPIANLVHVQVSI